MKHSKYHLFADDMQIYLHADKNALNDAVAKINEDLECLLTWTQKYGLNPRKPQVIIMGHKQLLSSLDSNILPPVVLEGFQIPYSDAVKNLGIYQGKSKSLCPYFFRSNDECKTKTNICI